jgi:hypothetical protein
MTANADLMSTWKSAGDRLAAFATEDALPVREYNVHKFALLARVGGSLNDESLLRLRRNTIMPRVFFNGSEACRRVRGDLAKDQILDGHR